MMKLLDMFVEYSRYQLLLIASPFLLYVSYAALHRCFKLISSAKTLQNVAIRALRCGAIPKHIAFIMDGNRRWAQKCKMPSHKGHAMGRKTLAQVLQWCLKAGVETVTVYAWSLENFKRPDVEVTEIMRLAEDAAKEFKHKQHFVHENRVQIRFLGDLARVPLTLQRHMAELMSDTMQYSGGLVLNICFSYTSRHDIANSIAELSKMVRRRGMKADAICDEAVGACLSTGWAKGSDACMHPQLLVRTSGETRLSDFLLYESCHSVLSFYPVLWPDLCAWDFVKMVLDYQHVLRRRAMARCGCATIGTKSSRMHEEVRAALMQMRCQHVANMRQGAVEEGKNAVGAR